MIPQELKEAVVKEGLLLRKYATKKEKRKLKEFSYLDSLNRKMCIYGQMTGDAFNDRATELKKLCANDTTFTSIEDYVSYKNSKISILINLIKS